MGSKEMPSLCPEHWAEFCLQNAHTMLRILQQGLKKWHLDILVSMVEQFERSASFAPNQSKPSL